MTIQSLAHRITLQRTYKAAKKEAIERVLATLDAIDTEPDAVIVCKQHNLLPFWEPNREKWN